MCSSRNRPDRLLAALALSLTGWLTASPAPAQYNPGTPRELEHIGVTEKLGAPLPLELEFVDDRGRTVRLADYFDGRRPVILTLNYYRCPMLCGLLLNGLLDAIKPLDWTPGGKFQIVTLSFDPLEGPQLARAKKQTYINELGRADAAGGWHFLTGQREAIRRLTEAVGFSYAWNEKQQEWAHPATLIFCTPDGKVARYLGGVMFEPGTVRMALLEASQGRIGSLFDQVFMTCFHYDADAGRYTASAVGLMRLGGGLTLAVLAVTLAVLWRMDVARKRRVPAANPT